MTEQGGRGTTPRSRRVLGAALGAVLATCGAPATAQAALSASIDGPVGEGASGAGFTVTIARSGGLLQGPASVRVRATGGTATPRTDHAALDERVSIPGSVFGTSASVRFAVLDDALDEADESVVVTLSEASGDVVAGDGAVSSAILDDDAAPALRIEDAAGVEGTGAAGLVRLPVRLSAPSGRAVSVRYAVTPGAASASDIDVRGGTVSLAPGTTAASVTVPTVADAIEEPDETFSVALSDPLHATVARARATGTVVDDDVAPPPAPVTSPPASSPPPPPAPAPGAPLPAAPVLGAGPAPAAATPPASAGPDWSRPDVRVHSISLRRPRTLRVRISCPEDEVRCRVRTTVFTVPSRKAKRRALRREIRVARVTRTLRGGTTRTVTARMTRRSLRLLRSARRLRVRAYAVARDEAGNMRTGRRTATIRR